MRKFRIKKSLIFAALTLVLIGFIGFVEKKDSEKVFTGIEIRVKGIADVYFVNEKDILKNIQTEFPLMQKGVSMQEVDLNKIEKKVETYAFVSNAEVFADPKGHVMVEITQHIPIARIVRPSAADGYISTEGKILPTSNSYTTRVMTLEGAYAENLLKLQDISESHSDLMAMINFINEDEFWKAQISGMDISRKTDIKLYQQVGKQVIEFGEAKDLEEKFEKINLFYEEIIPAKGWNAYSRVSVKYKGQIVCE
ncbi:cell division protein FtsQ/DivIB [Aquiflexum gelatinilyticum]|uniref:Cell division protein n=1 Tax=Aquiflexum gelatinilyticum TaxID=2961943 RepID=A0A9X2SY82_9BACT|nr:cell division protein [Aquiflexum gelatinilyticum]MCR9014987.1 cell division protein [Aquiflexum gelatinilyticum]